MKITTRHNRITAFLVAMLYVFFSTCGAVAHTDASPRAGRDAYHVSHSTQTQAADASREISSQQHCAVCDWQANYAPLVIVPECAVTPLSIDFPQVHPSFSFFSVCLPRFSSRAPPIV